ncbi:MAG: phosphoribosylamine--glycine ligase [Acidimicrobiia bacterium]|nr:MAG: phosphoribosylamine--glycine ligase [Acidimicrobiia bacterium]
MRVLLLGGGGREHALGWKLAQSPLLTELISAPGNPGLAALGETVEVNPLDPETVAAFAHEREIDLVVIGPEAPLAAGVVDALDASGIPAFGPTAAGARLEASKAYAKEMMARAGVPTAAARVFTDVDAADFYLDETEGPFVVKADGLAAGKGVLVTTDRDAAKGWAAACLGGVFGDAGSTIVIEQHLEGREVSVFVLVDGERALPLAPARDYKRLRDADEGPNTGGMGSYSPVDDLPGDLVDRTIVTAVEPVLGALAADDVSYRGFLYVGLILTDEGPKVLEFNCRLGDPEAQAVLPRLDEDLLELLAAASAGALPDRALRWSETAAVDVVLASAGYPVAPEHGAVISGVTNAEKHPDALVIHAGTANTDAGLVTAGGRVLNVVGLGDTVEEARSAAYAAVGEIEFAGMQMRTDIGR